MAEDGPRTLFIGGIPRSLTLSEFEELFSKYGRIETCQIKSTYGFVTFADSRDAQEALQGVHRKEVHGVPLNVEWSKGKRKGENNECFICNKQGHWARDCPEKRSRRSSRSPPRRRSSRSPRRRSSRSPRRYSRSPPRRRSRSPPRHRDRSPDRYRRRSPSPRKRSPSPRGNANPETQPNPNNNNHQSP